MKRMPYRKLQWLNRRARCSIRRTVRRRKAAFQRRLSAPIRAGLIIQAPVSLGVYGQNGIALRRMILGLHKRVLEKGAKAVLDCSSVRSIAPHGAILLHAELDRVATTSQLTKPIKIIPPKCRRCRQVFKQ